MANGYRESGEHPWGGVSFDHRTGNAHDDSGGSIVFTKTNEPLLPPERMRITSTGTHLSVSPLMVLRGYASKHDQNQQVLWPTQTDASRLTQVMQVGSARAAGTHISSFCIALRQAVLMRSLDFKVTEKHMPMDRGTLRVLIIKSGLSRLMAPSMRLAERWCWMAIRCGSLTPPLILRTTSWA